MLTRPCRPKRLPWACFTFEVAIHGLWDWFLMSMPCEAAMLFHRAALSNAQCVYDRASLRDMQDAQKAAKRLTDEAYSRGSNDNISAIVLRFRF